MDSVLGRAQAKGTGVKTAEPGWGRVSHIPLQMPLSITGGKTVASSKQRCKALSPTLLGQGRDEQPEGPTHEVQAAGDQDMDSSRLPQQHGPAAGCGVRVSPRGHRGCQMGVPALCYPPQRLGQAWEHESWGIEGSGGLGHQEQGASAGGWLQQPPHPRGRWEPGVLPHFLLQEPCPRLLVLQAAGQGVLQRHIEVLLVWEGWEQAVGDCRGS